MELAPGSVFAGHRLEAVAGRGGMGIVYRATDLMLDRQVALKVIATELAGEPQFVQRFTRESRVAASINHPHVLPIYRAGEEEGRLFITMQLVEGRNLGEQLVLDGPFEPPTAARLISQVASALDAAHARGLVHRDVKPGNILLELRSDGVHAYLTDFGLTKLSAADVSGLTETGVIVGTLDYMAPEQMLGEELDARTDIYSLGCVLFQALSGRVPYPQKTPVAKMHAHANLPVPSLREMVTGLPPGMDAVVARAMAKDRAKRYLSAGDLGRAAVAAAAGATPQLEERSVAAGPASLIAPVPPTEVAPTTLRAKPPPVVPPAAPAPTTPVAEPPPTTPLAERRGGRVLPVALAILAILAAGGIAAAVLGGSGDDEEPAPAADTGGAQTTQTESEQAAQTGGGQTTTQATTPPLAGPRDCGGGVTAGANTSCPFAEEVRAAYNRSGQSVLDVASPVTGQTYRMYCTGGPAHVCTGGNNASVYFGDTVDYATGDCGGGLSVGPNTSCAFAANVRSAYERSGSNVVTAYSPATGLDYTMYCTDTSPHTCTGGKNAAVYFP